MPIWGGGNSGGAALAAKTSQHQQPGKKGVTISLLNREELQLFVEVKAKVQELFDQVCFMLGIKDPQFFGLCIIKDKESEFLDPKHKLNKYAPKGWKSDPGNGVDESGKPLLVLLFRVHLYAEHVSLIKDDAARHHYYLQLQQNVLSAPVLCREEACFVLASYSLQADMGNYSEESHKGRYFEPAKYFPEWVIKRRGENYILRHVPAMHRDQRGISRALAQRAFIREASTTIEHTMHFYRLKRTKTEESASIWLGISTRGIQMYEDSGEGKYLLCEYAWGIIKRLLFQKKKFELQVDGVSDGRKIVYYTCSENKSKHLIRLCKVTHAFQMQTQIAVERAKKRESATEKKYRESYISGDISWSDLDSSMTTTSISEMSTTNVGIQRWSVVSNVSSVATSGIVSDERSPTDHRTASEAETEADSPSTSLPSTLKRTPSSGHETNTKQLDYRPAAAARRDPLVSSLTSKHKRNSALSSDSSHHMEVTHIPTTHQFGSGREKAIPALPCQSERVNTIPALPIQGAVESASFARHEDNESDIDWESEEEDNEADDEEDPEVTLDETLTAPSVEEKFLSSQPPMIDPQSIQAEIAAKEMKAPLLSALCSDESLLLMQHLYSQQTTQGRSPEVKLSRTPSSHGSGSIYEGISGNENDLNNSLTTLVSHSSIDSDLHHCFMDILHSNSMTFLNSPTSENMALSMGALAKHQTLSNLKEADLRLALEMAGASDARLKCQTLPPKMNASEQMLLMAGAAGVIREEYVSQSAPNLSPGAQVTVATH